MGYQESLIKVKSQKVFNDLLVFLKNNEEYLRSYLDYKTIVTFKERVSLDKGVLRRYTFDVGEKCVCIAGERFASNVEFIFGDSPLGKKVDLFFIEEFSYKRGCFIGNDILEKMFVSHELADEEPFDKYLKKHRGGERPKSERKKYLVAWDFENGDYKRVKEFVFSSSADHYINILHEKNIFADLWASRFVNGQYLWVKQDSSSNPPEIKDIIGGL